VAFVEPKRPVHATGASGGEGGYTAYFGSVPDFGESDSGFKFADIRVGSPADKAGLRKGDVLTRFDGKPIKTIYDFTFALRSKRPGDKVEVVVMRDGQEIKATVELGSHQ
jgi:S1-C subfamily serine protease